MFVFLPIKIERIASRFLSFKELKALAQKITKKWRKTHRKLLRLKVNKHRVDGDSKVVKERERERDKLILIIEYLFHMFRQHVREKRAKKMPQQCAIVIDFF